MSTTDRVSATGAGALRPEIQALRALAVSLVVVFHLWPNRLTGGYVGVDVFFVVSGFLITTHLVRELDRSGRIALGSFWARRARRLLPAALVVLGATAAGTYLFVPSAYWQQFMVEIGASALYVENWVLAGDAVDYLAADNDASPVQHYWSLSVEEQFYLAWPLVLLGAAWVAGRTRVAGRRTVLALALGLITVASLAWSVRLTALDPAPAYFVTPVRAWEFAAGGLLGVVAASPLRTWRRTRTAVSWAGLAGITVAAVTYTAATPFPGHTALLPVVATLAVIWAGAPEGAWSPARLARTAPVAFVGQVSYSAYLWHWPLIVILPSVLGRDLDRSAKLGVLVAVLVLAHLTRVLVEEPVRAGGFLARRPARATFAAVAAATTAILVVSTSGWLVVERRVEQSRAAAQSFATGGSLCFGAGAMDPARACRDPFANPDGVDAVFAKQDLSHGMSCLESDLGTDLVTCRHGRPDAPETVALIGDSHAASWWDAVTAVADAEDWQVVTYLKAGCPALGTDRLIGPRMTPQQPGSCEEWSQAVLDRLVEDESVTRVFTGYRSDIYKYVDDAGDLQDAIPQEVAGAPLQRLADAGRQVYVLRAVPTTGGVGTGPELSNLERSAPDCLVAAGAVDDPCSGDRAHLVVPDYLARAAEAVTADGIEVVDLTDRFCDAQRCHSLIGGVSVYWDGSHITATFSRSLAPFLAAAVAAGA